MVLNDDRVDDYVNTDISELDYEKANDDPELGNNFKLRCQEKLKFRYKMAQNVSLFRMDYMLRVMKKCFGKYSIAHPKGFKSKLKKIREEERNLKQLKRKDSINSTSTGFISQSKQSDGVSRHTSDNESKGDRSDRSGDGKHGDGDEGDHDEDGDKGEKKNNVVSELNTVISTMKKDINSKCQERLKEVKKLYTFNDDIDPKDEWDMGQVDPLDELVQEMSGN